MTPRRKLAMGAAIIVLGLAFAAYQGARSSLVYYLTPTEFATRPDLRGVQVRLAGQVAPGSVERAPGDVRFVITDAASQFRVHFTGPLPDLFAEGRQVLVEGKLDAQGWLQADQVITTHPSEYKEKHPDRAP